MNSRWENEEFSAMKFLLIIIDNIDLKYKIKKL